MQQQPQQQQPQQPFGLNNAQQQIGNNQGKGTSVVLFSHKRYSNGLFRLTETDTQAGRQIDTDITKDLPLQIQW